MPQQKTALIFLRFGIAFVFFYAAIFSFLNPFLINHNVQPTLSTSEKVKDVHLPLHTAHVIARSAATRQSSAFDFVAAFLDCRVAMLLAMTI